MTLYLHFVNDTLQLNKKVLIDILIRIMFKYDWKMFMTMSSTVTLMRWIIVRINIESILKYFVWKQILVSKRNIDLLISCIFCQQKIIKSSVVFFMKWLKILILVQKETDYRSKFLFQYTIFLKGQTWKWWKWLMINWWNHIRYKMVSSGLWVIW